MTANRSVQKIGLTLVEILITGLQTVQCKAVINIPTRQYQKKIKYYLFFNIEGTLGHISLKFGSISIVNYCA
jgi:uncharacterized membrane protein (Fun14 family)